MTNKEFQNKLKQYPDTVDVFMDNNFGWNTPSNTEYVDPGFATHSDESGYMWGIELIPNGEYAPMNLETIDLIFACSNELGFIPKLSEIEKQEILKLFKRKYE